MNYLKTIAFIILFIITSWALIHLLALFGLFLAFAYPLWWFITPRNTTCFICRSRRPGDWCPFCGKRVEAKANYPKSIKSTLLNSTLIAIVSILSFGIIFLESKILFQVGFPPTPKTASFNIPDKKQYRLGEIFPVKIDIKGIQTNINAVQADLEFNPEKLEVADISTEESFANVFIQREINNESGYVRLSGGIPNPGFQGENGIFGTIFFQGKNPGLAEINFLPSSMILANDGRGTNVIKELSSASYLILPERISQDEEELQKNLITTDQNQSTSTKIAFYEETSILGTSTLEEIEKEKSTNIFKMFLAKLEEFDTFVISLWGKVFGFE